MSRDRTNIRVCSIPLFFSNPPVLPASDPLLDIPTSRAVFLHPGPLVTQQPVPLVAVQVLQEPLVGRSLQPGPLAGVKLLPGPTDAVEVFLEQLVALPLEPGPLAAAKQLPGPPVRLLGPPVGHLHLSLKGHQSILKRKKLTS